MSDTPTPPDPPQDRLPDRPPDRPPGAAVPRLRRTVAASVAGATFEWFDFGLYGTSAAVVFNVVFFPELSPLVGTLVAFATAAAGYVARPVGGLIFGHLGDRLGRKRMLVATMVLMAVPTFCVGLLPSYASIGAAAPILLVLLRLVQGIGLGGEYAGAALTTIESAPLRRRGFFGSLPQAGNPLGGLLASGLVAAFSALPGDAYEQWGWRVPFLLSVVLLAFGLYVRLRLTETADFAAVVREGAQARRPLVELVRGNGRNLLLAAGARVVDSCAGNTFGGVATAYVVTQLALPRSVALLGGTIATAVELAVIPVAGLVADRIGPKPVYLTGVAAVGLMAFPYFLLLDTRQVGLIWVAQVLGLSVASGIGFAVQSTLFSRLFGVNVRYSGISVAYQFTSVIGGFVPLGATAIILASGGRPWLVAALLVLVAVGSFACTWFTREVSAEPQDALKAVA